MECFLIFYESWIFEERARKILIALYCYKNLISKRWGFSPKVVWLYVKIWRALERAALIGKYGALGSTSTMTLNLILNLVSIDIVGKCVAAKVAIRLYESGLLN